MKQYCKHSGIENYTVTVEKYSHCEKESICEQQNKYTGESNCKQYRMYQWRFNVKIVYRQFYCNVWKNIHIVKRKAYVNSAVSLLGTLIVNSTASTGCLKIIAVL